MCFRRNTVKWYRKKLSRNCKTDLSNLCVVAHNATTITILHSQYCKINDNIPFSIIFLIQSKVMPIEPYCCAVTNTEQNSKEQLSFSNVQVFPKQPSKQRLHKHSPMLFVRRLRILCHYHSQSCLLADPPAPAYIAAYIPWCLNPSLPHEYSPWGKRSNDILYDWHSPHLKFTEHQLVIDIHLEGSRGY